jgi:hypothetical protein
METVILQDARKIFFPIISVLDVTLTEYCTSFSRVHTLDNDHWSKPRSRIVLKEKLYLRFRNLFFLFMMVRNVQNEIRVITRERQQKPLREGPEG